MRSPRLLIAFLAIVATTYGQQKGSLHGTIFDNKNDGIPYANVLLKNSAFTAISNENGKFEINDIPYGSYELVASTIGYQSIVKVININQKRVTANIELADDVKQLEEVIVQTEKQSTLQEQKTIAIKSVDIREVITQNTLLTDVADRISGVRIRRSSSLGEKSDISINGMRGNAVRIYIDGLPMEFLYPNFDISTLPISNVSRMDVYKGVLPVDVGTDAMGGAINIVTAHAMNSHVRASYSYGSFNTHMADFEVGLANKKNFFITANGAYNYSDNNYSMNALVYETNKVEKVKRFHDGYQMSFAGLNMGVHSKPWADELRLTANYATGYKELQNGARISILAIGQAKYTSDNFSSSLKYNKAFLNERLTVSNNAALSYQTLDFVDTTSNKYSWSGNIVSNNQVRSQGEYAGAAYTNTKYLNIIDRLTTGFKIAPNHGILISNLFAKQRLEGTDFLTKENERDYLAVPQYLTKNIIGLEYDGKFFTRLSASAAIKRFDYILDGAENNTFLPFEKKDHFMGWNASLKYDVLERLYVKASYERGFLIPSFYEFVGNGNDILRNTDLKPESSDNVNLGIGYASSHSRLITISTAINAFYRQQYDMIFLKNTAARQYENTDQVKTVGVDGEVIVTYNKNWIWRSNITALRKEFSYLKDPRNAQYIGTPFPNNPTFYANTELSWQKTGIIQPLNQIRVYAYYQYVAPFNHIQLGQKDNYKNSPASFVPTQNRVDIGTSYQFAKKRFTAAFNVINVFNAELYDNFRVPRAGTNYNIKLIFEIKNLKQL